MTSLLRVGCAVVIVAIAMPASAQSLADVARKEEARRTTAARAIKSYSNADLRPPDIASSAASEPPKSCYESSSLSKCVPAEELLTRVNASTPNTDLAKEEGGWRRTADQIRSQVTKLQEELESVEAIAADQSRSAGERAMAASLVAKKTASLRAHHKRWETLEKDAAFKRVPHAWLEPVPEFPPPQE